MTFPTQCSVAVVIPSFNEEETILKLVTDLLQFDFINHIIIVDDSPNENTIKQLSSLKDNSRIIVKHRSQKGGRGSAVLDGITYLITNYTPDYIIEMDADFSHRPEEIPAIIEKIHDSKAGLVVASRYLKQSQINNWPISRRLFSKVANIFARSLLRIPLSDYTNGFRAYTFNSAKLLTEKPLLGTGFIALSDVLVRIYYHGHRIAEIPSIFNNRVRGESSLNLKEISNAFFGIFKIYTHAKILKRQRN